MAPIPFRLSSLNHPRHLQDIEMVGKQIAWHLQTGPQLANGQVTSHQKIDETQAPNITEGRVHP